MLTAFSNTEMYWFIIPEAGIESTVPKLAPQYTHPANLERSLGGAHLLSMACIAGNVTPSPNPSNILTAVNIPTPAFAAAGVSNVKMEVIRTPKIWFIYNEEKEIA